MHSSVDIKMNTRANTSNAIAESSIRTCSYATSKHGSVPATGFSGLGFPSLNVGCRREGEWKRSVGLFLALLLCSTLIPTPPPPPQILLAADKVGAKVHATKKIKRGHHRFYYTRRSKVYSCSQRDWNLIHFVLLHWSLAWNTAGAFLLVVFLLIRI